MVSLILAGLWTADEVNQSASFEENNANAGPLLGPTLDFYGEEDKDLLHDLDSEEIDDILLSDCSLNDDNEGAWLDWFQQEIGPTEVDFQLTLSSNQHDELMSNLNEAIGMVTFNNSWLSLGTSDFDSANFCKEDATSYEANELETSTFDVLDFVASPFRPEVADNVELNSPVLGVAPPPDEERILSDSFLNTSGTSNTSDVCLSSPISTDSEVLSPPPVSESKEKENQPRKNKRKSGVKSDASKDRKRIRNQVSAAKYRSKKKELKTAVFGQCAALEARNVELKAEVKELQTSIDYLKDLLVEIRSR